MDNLHKSIGSGQAGIELMTSGYAIRISIDCATGPSKLIFENDDKNLKLQSPDNFGHLHYSEISISEKLPYTINFLRTGRSVLLSL